MIKLSPAVLAESRENQRFQHSKHLRASSPPQACLTYLKLPAVENIASDKAHVGVLPLSREQIFFAHPPLFFSKTFSAHQNLMRGTSSVWIAATTGRVALGNIDALKAPDVGR